jgi:hypothetical protein
MADGGRAAGTLVGQFNAPSAPSPTRYRPVAPTSPRAGLPAPRAAAYAASATTTRGAVRRGRRVRMRHSQYGITASGARASTASTG